MREGGFRSVRTQKEERYDPETPTKCPSSFCLTRFHTAVPQADERGTPPGLGGTRGSGEPTGAEQHTAPGTARMPRKASALNGADWAAPPTPPPHTKVGAGLGIYTLLHWPRMHLAADGPRPDVQVLLDGMTLFTRCVAPWTWPSLPVWGWGGGGAALQTDTSTTGPGPAAPARAESRSGGEYPHGARTGHPLGRTPGANGVPSEPLAMLSLGGSWSALVPSQTIV